MPAILLVHFVSLRKIKRKAMLFANYQAMEKIFGKKILSKNYPLLFIRVLILLFLIFSVAGMTIVYEGYVTNIDFVLAIDASASMLAQDYTPDRLAAAKDAALLFVDSVPGETKTGVLSFAGAGFVKQELTSDKEKIKSAIKSVDVELAGGTAIGDAAISSVNLLLGGQRNRVIILLTDGQNNIGPSIDEALAYAKRHNVKIDTIGIGTEEGGIVANTSIVTGLDAKTLEMIASQTGGKYYRAGNKSELESAYKEIASSTMQEISLDISSYLMLVALAMFLVELVMVNTKYRTIP